MDINFIKTNREGIEFLLDCDYQLVKKSLLSKDELKARIYQDEINKLEDNYKKCFGHYYRKEEECQQ